MIGYFFHLKRENVGKEKLLSKHHLNWSVSVVGISEFVVEDDLFFVVFVCLCVF